MERSATGEGEPSLEYAAEQWVRWSRELSVALWQRANRPGRSLEVVAEDVTRAIAPSLHQLMDRAQVSSDEWARAISVGLHLQGDALLRQAALIDHWLGEAPEDDG